MSNKSVACEEPSHEIQTWNSQFCDFLYPYWQKTFLMKPSIVERNTFSSPFLTTQTHTVELSFHLCSILDQPLPVYFLSVDIFDIFISNHISQLFESIADTQSDERGFSTVWSSVCAHINSQLYLRLLSCIQLASKIVFTGQLVTTSQIQSILADAQQNFQVQSIITSEFRVFKTLGFKIPLYSSLDMLEQLLEMCVGPLGLNSEKMHPTCVAVLKLVYLQHAAISSRMATSVCAPKFPSLLAGGSLLTACRLTSVEHRVANFLYLRVATHTNILQEYFRQFVDLVFSMVVQ